MYSVTRRVNGFKQPRGGYLNPKQMKVVEMNDGIILHESESILPTIMGIAVEYLTRFMLGVPKESVFHVSEFGAFIAGQHSNAKKLLKSVNGLDKKSIVSACRLAGYDACYRAGPDVYKPVIEIKPDKVTVENIVTMVNRSLRFWEEYGPVIKDGFTFNGGYTNIISSGDGDFLTKDTLWDFKVSKSEPTAKNTLQILIYYLMGTYSKMAHFMAIDKIGIYNPRKNKCYIMEVSSIPESVISEVSKEVIGYQ